MLFSFPSQSVASQFVLVSVYVVPVYFMSENIKPGKWVLVWQGTYLNWCACFSAP